MTDLRQAAQQALECIERLNAHGWILADFEDEVYAGITALRTALEQPPLPVQEPVAWNAGVAPMWPQQKEGETFLVSYTPPPQQQAKMRMPRVGDRVICLEDESLGEVVSLTAGGSPDIVFDDGSRGTYMVHEFAELFGYAEQRQQQAEPRTREGFERWAKSLPNYIDLSRFEDGYSDCNTDYAWAGWQAAQRPWVGLTDDDFCYQDGEWADGASWAEAKLKERNT
jgi:hypothetical protein